MGIAFRRFTRPATRALQRRSIERAYEQYAGVYDVLFEHLLQPGRRAAVQGLGPDPGDHVLEVGIGTGLSVPFYPLHCHVTGIDLSAAMLREAEERRATHYPHHRLELRRMDAERLDFPDGTFDRVLASYVISTAPEPARVLDEIVRVCRPGGVVVVINHFRSKLPPVAWVEQLLRPITWRLGFRMDLPLTLITEHPRLEVERIERANFLGLWKLVVARVRNGA